MIESDLKQPVANKAKGVALMFPFAISEAKRDKGDNWDDIWAQTVIPIFTMLNLQRKLFQAGRARLPIEPIVWFFLMRGAEWRVYLAYQERSTGNIPSYSGYITVSVDF